MNNIWFPKDCFWGLEEPGSLKKKKREQEIKKAHTHKKKKKKPLREGKER